MLNAFSAGDDDIMYVQAARNNGFQEMDIQYSLALRVWVGRIVPDFQEIYPVEVPALQHGSTAVEGAAAGKLAVGWLGWFGKAAKTLSPPSPAPLSTVTPTDQYRAIPRPPLAL